VALWLFNFFSLSKYAKTSPSTIKEIQNKLLSNQFDDAIAACNRKKCFFSKIMAAGVSSRKYGLQFMLESMKSEGKRVTVSFLQRLNIIHDIAIIAPMIGLLGTVLGMFYAFYDLNRSFETRVQRILLFLFFLCSFSCTVYIYYQSTAPPHHGIHPDPG
jgi:biopolymer transport protein ExbB